MAIKYNPIHPITLSPEDKKITETANRILSDASRGLVFDEKEHRYFLGGREMRSVSSIVESYAPFDSEGIALRCSRNPKHELYGKSVEEILSVWQARADAAAGAGTVVHEFGEACFCLAVGRPDLIPEGMQARLSAEGLEASSAKEVGVAKWWSELDTDRYLPVAKETRLVCPPYDYAGTFDLLLWDRQTQSFALRDYKTNADLHRWFGGSLLAPLSPIRDDDHGKYTLQQNLYSMVLENLRLRVSDRELIWLKEDGCAEEVNIPDRETLVRFAMETELRKRQQQNGRQNIH